MAEPVQSQHESQSQTSTDSQEIKVYDIGGLYRKFMDRRYI